MNQAAFKAAQLIAIAESKAGEVNRNLNHPDEMRVVAGIVESVMDEAAKPLESELTQLRIKVNKLEGALETAVKGSFDASLVMAEENRRLRDRLLVIDAHLALAVEVDRDQLRRGIADSLGKARP